MKYLAVLTLAATMALGFVPESFRMQSTAGIWEDDLDLILDPARATLVEGRRVYTNLANYVTSGEEQFGVNSSGFFLVGGSTHLRERYAPAGIFDRTGYENPLFTGLFSPDSLDSLFGSARSVYTVWRDLDTNGSYDFKQVQITERSAWEKGAGSDLYLGLGFTRGGDKPRFGLGFLWNDSCARTVDPSLDYIFHDYDSSLIIGRLTYRFDDTSRASQRLMCDRKRFILSARFSLKDDATLGVNLQPTLTSRNDAFDRTAWGYADYNPGNAVPDFDSSGLFSRRRVPESGLEIPLNVELFRLGRPAVETRWYLGGLYVSRRLGSDAQALTVANSGTTLNPGFDAGFDSTLRSYHGGGSRLGGYVGLRRLHALGEKLSLGWGARLNVEAWSDSPLDDYAATSIMSRDNGDSLTNRLDYRVTVTSAESWLERRRGVNRTLAIPVGLEYRPWSGVALRLGASQSIAWDDSKITNQLLSLAPRKTRVDYGDGTFQETVDETQANPGSSETVTNMDQTTQFSYGAGFSPTPNLQIDLMGFANLTNLANWRLSAVFRF